jgi:predicted ATPase
MSETTLLRDVVPRSLNPALPTPLPGSLIGRDGELARISEFVGRASRGGDAMLVTGEPGVGKTALLDAAAERAMARGFRVLRASGVEFEADVPFAGLHQVLVPLAAEFGQLRGPHLIRLISTRFGKSSGVASLQN